jgi:hypothetical protein
MALSLIKPLKEMSTRNLSGGKGWPVTKTDNRTAICEPTVWKMWKPRRVSTLWASTVCYGTALAVGKSLKEMNTPELLIEARRMRLAGLVARMGDKKNAYRLLVGKPEGKRPLGRPRRRWVGVMWTGLVWLRIGTGGELLRTRY